MIIDGHAHACGDYLTSNGILTTLKSNNVDFVLLSPGEINSQKTYPMPALAELFPKKNVAKITNFMTKMVVRLTGTIKEIPIGNEYVHDLTTKSNGKVLQSLWITGTIGNTESYLTQKFEAWRFKSVKIHQCWENAPVDSPFFQTVARWVESNDMPLFIHLSSDDEVVKIIDFKKNHHGLKVIIAHLFGLELFIKDGYKDDNLYFDISSLQYTSTLRVKKAIEHFGAEKVVLGSDTPYGKNNLKRNIERLYSLNITDSEKEMIAGENMRNLLGL